MSIFEDTLDHYAANNALTDSNIYYKFIFAIATIIVNLFAQSPIVPIIIFLFMTVLIVFKAKIPAKFFATFMAVPVSFGIITAIFMSLFFGIGPHIYDLGIFGWGITADGVNRGILVLAKILSGVSCLGFLVLTTPVNRLFSIADDLKVPYVVTDLAMLMYRYIFLFLDVTSVMYNSQKTRLGYSSYRNSFDCLGQLAGMIFIRTWEQGEVSYQALASRGYNGRLMMLRDEAPLKDVGIILLILLIVFELLLIVGMIVTGSTNVF